MPILCFGPVCIPMNLLLPFLLGLAHQYGMFKFIKKEWVTFRYWKRRFDEWRGVKPKAQPAPAPGKPAAGASGDIASVGGGNSAAGDCTGIGGNGGAKHSTTASGTGTPTAVDVKTTADVTASSDSKRNPSSEGLRARA